MVSWVNWFQNEGCRIEQCPGDGSAADGGKGCVKVLEGVHCGNFYPRDMKFTGPNGEYDGSGKLHILDKHYVLTCKYGEGIDGKKQFTENCVKESPGMVKGSTDTLRKKDGYLYWCFEHLYKSEPGTKKAEIVINKKLWRKKVRGENPFDFIFKNDDQVYYSRFQGKVITLCTISAATCEDIWEDDFSDKTTSNWASKLAMDSAGTLYFGGFLHQVSKCDESFNCQVILGGPNRALHKEGGAGFWRIENLAVAQSAGAPAPAPGPSADPDVFVVDLYNERIQKCPQTSPTACTTVVSNTNPPGTVKTRPTQVLQLPNGDLMVSWVNWFQNEGCRIEQCPGDGSAADGGKGCVKVLEGVHCGNFYPRDMKFTGPNGEYDGSGKLHILDKHYVLTCKYGEGIDGKKQFTENCVKESPGMVKGSTDTLRKKDGYLYWCFEHLYKSEPGTKKAEIVINKKLWRKKVRGENPFDFIFKNDDQVYYSRFQGKVITLCTISAATCEDIWEDDFSDKTTSNWASKLAMDSAGTLYFGGFLHQVSKCDESFNCQVILGGPNRALHKEGGAGFWRIENLAIDER